MSLIETAKDYGVKAVSGLTVASVIWIYTNFATKGEVEKLERINAKQWEQIVDLQKDVHAYDQIIKYYFKPNTN